MNTLIGLAVAAMSAMSSAALAQTPARRDGRDDGAVRARHRDLRPQQAPRRHDGVPPGAHGAVRARRHLSGLHRVRPASSAACRGWITWRRAATTSISSTCAATASRRGRRRCRKTPKNNPPIVRGDTAVKDIGAVVDFILKRRNIPRVNLIGWSWGTITDGDLHDAEPRQGRAAGALRAGLDPQDRRRWCRPARARSAPTARSRATRRWGAG